MKCISLNVKGLNLPEKRTQVLSALTKHKAHFILLQETHFRSDAIPKLTNHIYQTTLHATSPGSKTKGVSIIISKRADFHLFDSLIDPEGRYIFIKGGFGSVPMNIKFPSSKKPATFCPHSKRDWFC